MLNRVHEHLPRTVKAFLSWKFFQYHVLTNTSSLFRLYKFRRTLNRFETYGNFIFCSAKELVKYVRDLDKTVSNTTLVINEPVASSSLEMSQLQGAAARQKRKFISFSNSTDGKLLRFQTLHHHSVAGKKMVWCSLCGLLRGKVVGRRSFYRCAACGVNLFLHKSGREATNCWE